MRAYSLKNCGSSTLSQTFCSYDGLILVHAENKHRKLTNTNQLVSPAPLPPAPLSYFCFSAFPRTAFCCFWPELERAFPWKTASPPCHGRPFVFLIGATEKRFLSGMDAFSWQTTDFWDGKAYDVTESQVCPEALQNSAIRQSDQHSETRRTTRPILQIGPISQDAVCQTIWPLFE